MEGSVAANLKLIHDVSLPLPMSTNTSVARNVLRISQICNWYTRHTIQATLAVSPVE